MIYATATQISITLIRKIYFLQLEIRKSENHCAKLIYYAAKRNWEKIINSQKNERDEWLDDLELMLQPRRIVRSYNETHIQAKFFPDRADNEQIELISADNATHRFYI